MKTYRAFITEGTITKKAATAAAIRTFFKVKVGHEEEVMNWLHDGDHTCLVCDHEWNNETDTHCRECDSPREFVKTSKSNKPPYPVLHEAKRLTKEELFILVSNMVWHITEPMKSASLG